MAARRKVLKPALYLETSALIRVLKRESEGARRALERHPLVVTSALTFIEADRFLIRSRCLNELPTEELERIHRELREIHGAVTVMSIDEDIVARAKRPYPVEPLRSLDAIHVATLTRFRDEVGRLTVLSTDGRVRDNAVALGLQVLP